MPITITGTAGNDVITVAAVTNSPTEIIYTVNGTTTGPVSPDGPIDIKGLAGDDQITVSADVYLAAVLDGGAGSDVLTGGSGDDVLKARDGEADTLDGGLGKDSAYYESTDSAPTNCEIWQPFTSAVDNQTKHLKVLVVNFDPLVPSQGNRKLWDVFNWGDPYTKAAGYEAAIEGASGGAVDIDIVQWRNINEIPAFYDGSRYTPDQYYQNRKTNTGWNTASSTDVPRIFTEQNLAPLVDSGQVDEIWFFADHYFLVGGEAFMAGPGSFFINGPTFPQIPLTRAVACMGFSYERGVAEMLHNTGHRTESTLNRIYGGWNLATPTTNWDRFSANSTQSGGLAGVGTTHYPANASSDYDTFNATVVQSWADDYLNYPNLTGTKTPISRSSWGKGTNPDYERSYQQWYFSHLPRASGVNADGKQNNWWKYLYDFNNYTSSGVPKGLSASAEALDLYNLGGTSHRFTVTYKGAVPVRRDSLGAGDVIVTGPNGFQAAARSIETSDATDDTHIVATYEFDAPGGTWNSADRGRYSVVLQGGQVFDVLGASLPESTVGSISVRAADSVPLANDADTLLLLRLDGDTDAVGGETPTQSTGVAYATGKAGQAGIIDTGNRLLFSQTDNISAAAGTVEFWIRPDWNADGVTRQFFHAGNDFNKGMLLSIDGAKNLRFIQWGDEVSTPAVEVGYERGVGKSGASWTAGQWHHFAATWDSTTHLMELFVDGVSAGTSPAVTIDAFTNTTLAIGSRRDGTAPAAAAFDEVRISSRARTAGEIRADYAAGRALQSLSISAKSISLPAGTTTPFTAVAADGDGNTYDVTKQVKWTSSASAVASVDASGNVYTVKIGSASITAKLDTLSNSKAISVTDVGRPTATLVNANAIVSTFGQTTFDLTVEFADDDGIDVVTLGLGDVRVHGPQGFSVNPTLVGVDTNTVGTPRTATYRFTAPGGYWNGTDNGTYTVEILDHTVLDAAETPVSGLGEIGSFSVNVPSSKPPLITGFAGSKSYRENASPVVLAANLAVSDDDSGNFNSGRAVFEITSGDAGGDRLTILPGGSVTLNGASILYSGTAIGSFTGGVDAAPLVISWNGQSLPGKVRDVLRRVAFDNTGDNPGNQSRTIRLQLADGDGGWSAYSSVSVNVTAVNDAPIVTLSGTASYSEGDAPRILAPNGAVSDADTAPFKYARLIVTNANNANPNDRLTIAWQGNAAGQVNKSGTNVLYGGATVGTISGGAGTTPLTVKFNAAASPAAMEAVLRRVAFRTIGDAPSTLPRTITFKATDGSGGVSDVATKTVTVTAVNDAPVLSLGGTIGYKRGTASIALAPTATLTDVDSPKFTGGKLTISITQGSGAGNTLEIGGAFTLVGTDVRLNGASIGTLAKNGLGTNDLEVVFKNTATVSIAKQLVHSIRFKTTATAPTGTRMVSFVVTDDADGVSSAEVKKVTVK